MSDEITTPSVAPIQDSTAFIDRYRAFEARAAELHPANKASLFAALRDADIASVLVRFDGYGDSGQIEEIDAVAADRSPRDIPKTTVELQRLRFGDSEVVKLSQPLIEAIETLAYAFLESTHGGWENNSGACGEFIFDVAAGAITLEYNERYETFESYRHEF